MGIRYQFDQPVDPAQVEQGQDEAREEAPPCGRTRRSRESWRRWPSPSGYAVPSAGTRTGDDTALGAARHPAAAPPGGRARGADVRTATP